MAGGIRVWHMCTTHTHITHTNNVMLGPNAKSAAEKKYLLILINGKAKWNKRVVLGGVRALASHVRLHSRVVCGTAMALLVFGNGSVIQLAAVAVWNECSFRMAIPASVCMQ